MNTQPLDNLPLWALFVATLLVITAAVELGYWLGSYRKRLAETEKETAVGPVVGATLGLLAFMLAFTFGLAATRFDARRQIVVDDANAIGTAHLRAGLLPAPQRDQVRALLGQYLDARVAAVQSGDIERGIAASVALQQQLWTHAEALSAADPHSIATGLFIQSLNEMIDLHARRVLIGVRNRVPVVIWIALYVISALAMAEIGYHAGVAGSRRSLAVAALILTFAVVMLLIEDLDRPREGLLLVSQEALLELQRSLHAPADSGAPHGAFPPSAGDP